MCKSSTRKHAQSLWGAQMIDGEHYQLKR